MDLQQLTHQILNKKDLRFVRQDQAEDFARSQYNAYFQPQAVYNGKDGLFFVTELASGQPSARTLAEQAAIEDGASEVYYINSTAGEG